MQGETEKLNGMLCACRIVDGGGAGTSPAAIVGVGLPSSMRSEVRGAASFPDVGDAGKRAMSGTCSLR